MQRIFVVSDGTGGTAGRLVDAALTQFGGLNVDVQVRPDVRTTTELQAILAEADRPGDIVVHTLVSEELRLSVLAGGRLNSVPSIDLMGPLLAQLSDNLAQEPTERPGLHYTLNKAYFQRIEATEFAFRHDDGAHVGEVENADIVLVGVSRTFKTPLSVYLASKGWLVANVPILPERPIPPIVESVPPEKVFFLNTDTASLSRIRRSRHHYLGGVTSHYVDPESVRLELMHARRIAAAHPDWRTVTVTNKPIEEIASEILAMLRA